MAQSEQRYDAAAYDYDLPPDMIAQEPADPRDSSRLLVLDRKRGDFTHTEFRQLPQHLSAGDALVLNDTRVVPARVYGTRFSGGKVEVLFLRDLGKGRWHALLRCNGSPREGEWIVLAEGALQVRLLERGHRGAWTVSVPQGDLMQTLDQVGIMPLPPYIRRAPNDPRGPLDRERYQTVYARSSGAVAAPTAGLHFTDQVFADLEARGVRRAFVTLHVGAGTFRPITVPDVRKHRMHAEAYTIDDDAVRTVQEAREQGRRVVAVGTTSCRVLETASQDGLTPSSGETRLYITPGFEFAATDAVITNFHLPRSTLLVMICAFAGRERVLAAYEECKKHGYRFYSYGDAMLIL